MPPSCRTPRIRMGTGWATTRNWLRIQLICWFWFRWWYPEWFRWGIDRAGSKRPNSALVTFFNNLEAVARNDEAPVGLRMPKQITQTTTSIPRRRRIPQMMEISLGVTDGNASGLRMLEQIIQTTTSIPKQRRIPRMMETIPRVAATPVGLRMLGPIIQLQPIYRGRRMPRKMEIIPLEWLMATPAGLRMPSQLFKLQPVR